MKKPLSLFSLVALMCSCEGPSIKSISEKVFELAREQYVIMDNELAEKEFPRTFQNGEFVKSNLRWWTSGFYAGSLWYIYENTGDEAIKQIAAKNTEKLASILEEKTDHDIGFQVMCSYGNAYRLTRDEHFKELIPAAAERLCGRFSDTTKTIKSWDNKKWEYPVIIDNMMNLELLTTCSKMTGDEHFANVAKTHAFTTVNNHFRPDFTSWHLVNYDPANGQVLGKQTVQGYSDDSAWSRGQAWALYGFSMMYRETGETAFLSQAENIAKTLIEKLPEDGIPYWDFNAPDIPQAVRDASAGAIMASAFIELSTATQDTNLAKACLKMSEKQIRSLASDEYLAKKGENGNFILKHSVGSLPGNSEVDVPLTYADYYFLEALTRYSKLEK